MSPTHPQIFAATGATRWSLWAVAMSSALAWHPKGSSTRIFVRAKHGSQGGRKNLTLARQSAHGKYLDLIRDKCLSMAAGAGALVSPESTCLCTSPPF
jgi:hypothetical protein